MSADRPGACESLRSFVDAIEQTGELVRIDREIDLEYEVGALCRVASDEGSPALHFERLRGSSTPIVANLYGTRQRIALALGGHERTLTEDNISRLRTPVQPVEPEPATEALEERVVLRGDDVDLGQLPVPLWNLGDGGPFITAGVVLAHSAEQGPNAGVYRMQVHDDKTLGMYMAPDHHVRRVLEDPGRRAPIEVSIAIGAPPAVYIAGSSDFGLRESEAAIAGNLQGKPVRFAEGLTVSVPWPVETEIVIEGFLDGSMRQEGPFVEFTGCRSGGGEAPVVQVTAVHHKPDPVFHAAFVGRPPTETATVWREVEEAEALRLLQARFPIVTALHRPPDIGRDFFCVIQVDTRRAKPGMIGNLLAGAAYCVPRPKYVIAVDTDVDIYRLDQVLWVLCMRVHPQKDITLVPDTMGSGLDPRGPTPPLTAKLLIDATAKADAPGVMTGPPEELVTKARDVLAQYWPTR